MNSSDLSQKSYKLVIELNILNNVGPNFEKRFLFVLYMRFYKPCTGFHIVVHDTL